MIAEMPETAVNSGNFGNAPFLADDESDFKQRARHHGGNDRAVGGHNLFFTRLRMQR